MSALSIAMISYYLPSGSKIGVGHQVDVLASELVRRGHHVDVISECPAMPGAPYGVRRVELDGALRTFRFATAVRALDLSAYDVVHAHGDDYWLWRRRTGAHVRTLHGSNLSEALHIRGVKERTRMAVLGLSEVLSTAVADVTVAVSPGTRRWAPWVREVVPNGIDLTRFRPDPAQRTPQPVVLFVGTWGGRKRGRELAEAFTSTVRRRVPDAELWMVTRDAPAALPDGVTALGRVDDATLRRLYQQAWVFCLPSSYEGFGIPYVEAMASGTPVVATPNVGSRYVLDKGATGVLTPLGGLGEAISDLLEDPGHRAALSERGLQRAAAFSLSSVADRYEAIYHRVLAGRAPTTERVGHG